MRRERHTRVTKVPPGKSSSAERIFDRVSAEWEKRRRFSGDFIMAKHIGRVDLPHGDALSGVENGQRSRVVSELATMAQRSEEELTETALARAVELYRSYTRTSRLCVRHALPLKTHVVRGQAPAMAKSLRRVLAEIPDETILLSGHTDPTTMARALTAAPHFTSASCAFFFI